MQVRGPSDIRLLQNPKKQQKTGALCMEAVLLTSYDRLFITEDCGKPRKMRFINLEETSDVVLKKRKRTDCRKGIPGGDPLFVNIC